MDNKTLKSIAHQIPSTINPSISLSASKIIKAFITSKNKPSVIIVIGKVRIMSTGFTSKFKMERTTATKIAVR